jgi:hypothetical protein
MAIYELTQEEIRELTPTSFQGVGIKERGDLQRILKDHIHVVAPNTLIIAEEFGEWEDSRRRIDLLGLDSEGNIVVIELKRIDERSYMDLQAIRYAAMVSTLTFDDAVDIYGRYLQSIGKDDDPQRLLLEFLDWDEPDDALFAQDVRIVLAAEDFTKELTTCVLWLNKRSIDIRCIRLKPYTDEQRVFLDVQQVIPLAEAEEYQIKIREKEQKERLTRTQKYERYIIRKKFWTQLLDRARSKTDLYENISPSEYNWIGAGSGVRGLGLNMSITKHESMVELYIDRGKDAGQENRKIFDYFYNHKEEIESKFGDSLEWQKLDEKRASRIAKKIRLGGYRDDEDIWPKVHDAMIDSLVNLEKALRPHINNLSTVIRKG